MNEPPIDERLQLTKMPVLVGAVPAVTPIVSSVVCPGATVAGAAHSSARLKPDLPLARQINTPRGSAVNAAINESNSTVAELIPAAVESVLLVEYESDTPAEASRLACDLAQRLHSGERLALLAHVAEDEPARQRLWQVREAALPSLYGLRGTAQPLAFVEDVGVPPELLPGYLRRVQEVLQRHEIRARELRFSR